MIFYEGHHEASNPAGEWTVTKHLESGRTVPLLHKTHHSPDGYAWGYNGSGPADLALSLLADVIGPEQDQVATFKGSVGTLAWGLHQRFKRSVVAFLRDDWQLTALAIYEWIQDTTAELETTGYRVTGDDLARSAAIEQAAEGQPDEAFRQEREGNWTEEVQP